MNAPPRRNPFDTRAMRVGVMALAACTLAAAGVAAGALAALLSAPLAGGFGILAWWGRSERGPKQASQQVLAGVLGLLFSAAIGLAGSFAAALAAGLASLSMLAVGVFREDADMPRVEGAPRLPRGSISAFAAQGLDELVRGVSQVAAAVGSRPSPASFAADVAAAAERNRERGVLDDPARAHAVPPALEKVALRQLGLRGLPGASTLRFESEYEPEDPEVRSDYLAERANRTAHVTLLRNPDQPRPTLVCIHGYGMGRPAWDARVFEAARLERDLGLDVALFTLPWHGARRQGRGSGWGFQDGHPLTTNAAIGQAVWDLRRLVGWLREQGAPAVGVHGLSLGAYVAGLLASLDRRLAVAILSLPPASLSDLRLRDLTPDERQAHSAVGFTRACLEDAWSPHAILRHQPRVAPEGRMLVAGARDRICPPDQAVALWEHWERPAIHWHPGSHLLPLGRAATRARFDRHLREQLANTATAPLLLTRFRR